MVNRKLHEEITAIRGKKRYKRNGIFIYHNSKEIHILFNTGKRFSIAAKEDAKPRAQFRPLYIKGKDEKQKKKKEKGVGLQ